MEINDLSQLSLKKNKANHLLTINYKSSNNFSVKEIICQNSFTRIILTGQA
jgi:hypothetical protein